MNLRWIAVSLALLLTACATPVRQSAATFDRIQDELKEASAAAKPANSDALNQAMMPSLDLAVPPSAASVEPRFDLAVSAAPASQVFMALVSGTRYSMLVPPELTGTLSLNLKNVTVREALETIRDVYGYDFSIKGTRIFIQSNALQTRIFQINYLSSRRQGVSQTRVNSTSSSFSGTPGTPGNPAATPAQPVPVATPAAGGTSLNPGADSARVQTNSDADFWPEMKAALNAIVGVQGPSAGAGQPGQGAGVGPQEGRSVIVNAHSGVLLVRAMPAELRAVENYLRATQVMVERQVMLEAKIVEVQLNESYQMGINWAQFGTSGALTGIGSGVAPGRSGGTALPNALGKGFFGLAFQTANFQALLSFLESQGDAQVLSSPRIATINNQKAVLKVGTDDYFVTGISGGTPASTTTGTTGTTTTGATAPTITLQPFFSGVALDVTPQIDDDGNVILHVHPSVTVVQEKEKTVNLGSSFGSFKLPLASSTINETDSIVRVQDGNIVAIGGLMSQKQSKDRDGLPGLSSAPAVGTLFGQRQGFLGKRELVVLIKPTVIQSESSWRQDLADTQARIEQLDPRQRTAQPQ